MKIFIGYDDKEAIAFHVLVHSIIKRSSVPIEIIPLKRSNLKDILFRERGEFDSTDFSISRFLVPYLSGFEGKSIYMDCDMLCLIDINELLRLIDWEKPAVWVCKHDYIPKTSVKMDNQVQTKYPRKNWSSLIIFNNEKCTALTLPYVNTAPGLDLHRFLWLKNDEIWGLPLSYNWLVGEYPTIPEPKILHYTLGGPWMGITSDYDNAWKAELKEIR